VVERVAKLMQMRSWVGTVVLDCITKHAEDKCGVEQVAVVVVARRQASSHLESVS